jgi:hypothetical protein
MFSLVPDLQTVALQSSSRSAREPLDGNERALEEEAIHTVSVVCKTVHELDSLLRTLSPLGNATEVLAPHLVSIFVC